MAHTKLETDALYPVYRLTAARKCSLVAGSGGHGTVLERYRLVVGLAGNGRLILDGKIYGLRAGTAFAAGPRSLLFVDAGEEETLELLEADFEEVGLPPKEASSLGFPCLGYLELPAEVDAAKELENLSGEPTAGGPIERYERHLRFERLLLAIMKRNYCPKGRMPGMRKLVEATLDEIHARYCEPLRVDRLARSCCMSVRHYSRTFAELTGQSPVEYLTGLRIARSVRTLIASGGRWKEAAAKSGYADADYYGKRFKEKMGMSPSVYMRNWRKSPQIVALQCAGDLLALGVKPVGMMTNGLWGPLGGYKNGVAILDRDERISGTIASLRPDLIIAGDYTDGELLESLAKIAPTIEVEWEGIGPFRHLHMLGDLLGKQREKREWLTRYERTREELMEKLLAPDERRRTAAVFYMWRNEIRLFAPQIFPAFYDTLGYDAPPSFREWTERERRQGCIAVPFDRLPEYAADAMFLIVQDETAREAFRRMGRVYRDILPAIRNDRFHRLEPDWHGIDATSLYWQLGRLAELGPLLR
ncbi:helix-turn-helix domain-containing protein [Cohnella cellulosilytica]|uniref:Helix-turn-helix domain-containing protein n=1 Tax=Cohnella cellulosilytica TaxID=986710 RepID=A0ABW2FCZ1_9BACL